MPNNKYETMECANVADSDLYNMHIFDICALFSFVYKFTSQAMRIECRFCGSYGKMCKSFLAEKRNHSIFGVFAFESIF